MSAEDRISALKELVERQAARIADLEAMLVADIEPPVEWRLPRREAQIFAMLVKRDRVTKAMLTTAFWDETNCDSEENVWESHVSKMRKRLRPFGVVVESQHFLGYRLVDRHRYANLRRAA